MSKLSFSQVSLEFSDASTGPDAHVALSGLDFALGEGESVAIIGPSGCGKSSTLQMAAGLLAPSSGEVRIDGEPVRKPRHKTALILQDFGLLPWKTVRANAELGLKLRGVSAGERRSRALDALRLVGLERFADAYPDSLSGGMRQRLAIARSLALDVDLLLMDEPLSALDALLREQLQDTLLDLWQRGSYAQMLVTHSIEEAVYLGQRIIVMSPGPGRIVGEVENPEMGDPGYRSSMAFFEKANEVRSLLTGAAQADEASDQAAGGDA